jgi:hypothetical protein
VENVRGLGGRYIAVPGKPLRPSRRALPVAAVSSLPMQACSNCAGDYQDPDRTSTPDDSPEDLNGGDVDEGAESEIDLHSRERTGARELREKTGKL